MEINRMFGLGEPVSMQVLGGSIDAEEALRRIEALGVTAFREWMHIPTVLSDPDTVDPAALEVYSMVLDSLKDRDIEITGMSHKWFLAGEELRDSNNAMYARDLTPGSLYRQTLELLERSWYTMAKAFPQVSQWEVGNEWNLDQFLHPIGWKVGETGFSEDEKMDIAVDLMYFSAKGIRRGNPDAKVVSFSPAVTQPNLGGRSNALFCPPSYGMTLAISKIYERIKSGNFWSNNPDDYFDLIALHPYLLTQIMPMTAANEIPAERRFFRTEDIDAAWRAPIDMVYTIMSLNGDGKKQMLLTEMGFSDWDLPGLDEKQAAMQETLFAFVKTMPYVRTIHSFRLYAPELHEVEEGFLPMGEVCFGLFRKDQSGVYRPRRKAFTLQKIYGGVGELK